MARAVVIGANGFLGSHLVEKLVDAGHNVRAFDRFSSAEPSFATTGVEIVRGEFLSRTDLEEAVADQELVFHFLSTTTPATAESDPTLDVRTNVAQTIELLESCVSSGVRHFYFASTGGAIYGMQDKAFYRESDRALPVSPYGIGKLTIEHYLRYFGRLHDFRATSFRISNPYGPRQHENKLQGLIPIALRRISKGQPVLMFGDGSMVRDYVYVNDVVEMMMRVVHGDPRSDLYNIGSGVGYSVREVVDALREVVTSDFVIEQRPIPATFIDRVVLDMRRFEAEFGTMPSTSLRDGIRATAIGMGLLDG